MSSSLNTARALLLSGNYDGAVRLVNDALSQDKDDLGALLLLIEIREEQEDFETALDLILAGLRQSPNNLSLRMKELITYIRIGKKRRARLGIQQFKKDFPFNHDNHDLLMISFESKYGNDNRATKMLLESSYSSDKVALGIFYTNSGALFAGQKCFREALKSSPDNHLANVNLAYNQIFLSKFWSARKAASAALASKPENTEMQIIRKLTWGPLYPPILYYHLIFTIFWLAHRWISMWILILVFIFSWKFLLAPVYWFEEKIASALKIPWFENLSNVCVLIYFICFLFLNSKFRQILFSSRKKVRLKDY